jgi:HK97 family phage major capsid protein
VQNVDIIFKINNSKMTEEEKRAQAIEQKFDEVKGFMDKNKDLDFKGFETTLGELKKKFDEMPEMKDVEEIKSLNDAINDLNKEVKAMKKDEEETKSFTQEIDRILKDPETKAAFDKGEMKGMNGKTFEMKVDTTAFVGDVTRTQAKVGANYPREQRLTVTPLFSVVPMEQDKSRMLWVEGAYTSNVGYVGEGAAIGTDDTGTETEKTREVAKISAKIKFTAEMFEDRSAFAARLQNKLLFNSEKFINTNLISGDGDDTTNKKHIYGLITQGSTAFAAGDLADAYKDANIDDLATAINVQADEYTPTYAIMNKLTVAKYSRHKDTTGQYVIREVNGQKMLGGMMVVESYAMANDAMLAVDDTTLQLWLKRGMEFKIGQEASDLSTDQYTAVVFWRGQALVETPDKAANIYVADIDAALVALDPDRA